MVAGREVRGKFRGGEGVGGKYYDGKNDLGISSPA